MESSNYLRFSENYGGKLDKQVFTTIRPDDPSRYQVGYVYDIYLGKDKIASALMTRLDPIYNLRELNANIIKVDTGLDSVDEFIKLMEGFYGDVDNINWVMLTLKKV